MKNAFSGWTYALNTKKHQISNDMPNIDARNAKQFLSAHTVYMKNTVPMIANHNNLHIGKTFHYYNRKPITSITNERGLNKKWKGVLNKFAFFQCTDLALKRSLISGYAVCSFILFSIGEGMFCVIQCVWSVAQYFFLWMCMYNCIYRVQ